MVSPDPSTGASYFDFELRTSFMMFDDNRDGFINLREFAEFLKEDTRHLTASATQEQLAGLTPIFSNKAKEMKRLLVSNESHSDKTDRDVISWFEFKVFRIKCMKLRDGLCEFLKSYFQKDEIDFDYPAKNVFAE